MNNLIVTYTGRIVNLLDPDPQTIDIADIAHALSMICRFNGHLKCFYSVAAHCINIGRAIYEETKNPYAALQGLIHDFPEAYAGDVVTPLKGLLPNYREIDDRLMAAIQTRYHIPAIDYEMHKFIKEFDSGAVFIEAQKYTTHPEMYDIKPGRNLGISIIDSNPANVEAAVHLYFLRYYHHCKEQGIIKSEGVSA